MVGCLLIALLFKWTKKEPGKCKYDERQEIVRGKGFKYSFYALIIYYSLYAIIASSIHNLILNTTLFVFLGVCVGVTIHACYCIWNEGYFAINENPKRVILVSILISFMNFAIFIRSALCEEVIENGVLQNSFMNLFCGILLLIITFVTFVKYLLRQKED